MKIKKYLLVVPFFIFFFSITTVCFAATTYDTWTSKTAVSSNKIWSVSFTSEANSADVTDAHIYVKDSSNNVVPVTLSLSSDNETVLVQSLISYEASKTYTLYVENMKSKTGISLAKNIKMNFTISSSNTSTSKYSYGVIQNMDDENGQVIVNILGKGLVKYDYTDEWANYENNSIVMLDSSDKLFIYDSKNFKQDNLFDYKESKLKFSNITGSYDVASDVLVVLCDKSGNYVKQGVLNDLVQAVSREDVATVLIDPDTNKIKVIVIEQGGE
ncbi:MULTISPECIES: hypothetical protein [Clostridium]|uniref:SbsA Ig-like domain-containing protein n=1 Tax=Clostridium frigoriphilum TaxID=443253 RepID=A0ABU7UMC0_9CLOT|nr:hypothetical protein [Clostridium sp. DSM 17811]MBU3097668.1 hypothetical protein [Clostridium sp. DSM 17811]